MCNFFSFCVDETGKKYYFNWAQRLEQDCFGTDSHSRICSYYGINEDNVNKFEYNPLTREFIVDQINCVDNSVASEIFAKHLNFSRIVPALIIKPIVNPFNLPFVKTSTKTHLRLLSEWVSVRDSVVDSVRASVWDSVGDSVGDSVWDSVGASVWDSVGASVGDSVGASVGASVWDSVWASVGASVRASVRAYVSSFINIQYEHDFSPAIKLWESGLVPSFDGETWRLHSGQNADIVYEWTPQ